MDTTPLNHDIDEAAPEERQITDGQYLVGIDFNPGGRTDVRVVKQAAAEMIDYIYANGKDPRCTAQAVSFYEQAAEKAVKSLTKPPRPAHLK